MGRKQIDIDRIAELESDLAQARQRVAELHADERSVAILRHERMDLLARLDDANTRAEAAERELSEYRGYVAAHKQFIQRLLYAAMLDAELPDEDACVAFVEKLRQHFDTSRAELAALRTQNAELLRVLGECDSWVEGGIINLESEVDYEFCHTEAQKSIKAQLDDGRKLRERITAALAAKPKENAV